MGRVAVEGAPVVLAWVLNLDFAGSSSTAEPPVAPHRSVAEFRTSPALSWRTRWRTTGWIRLRPAGAA